MFTRFNGQHDFIITQHCWHLKWEGQQIHIFRTGNFNISEANFPSELRKFSAYGDKLHLHSQLCLQNSRPDNPIINPLNTLSYSGNTTFNHSWGEFLQTEYYFKSLSFNIWFNNSEILSVGQNSSKHCNFQPNQQEFKSVQEDKISHAGMPDKWNNASCSAIKVLLGIPLFYYVSLKLDCLVINHS